MMVTFTIIMMVRCSGMGGQQEQNEKDENSFFPDGIGSQHSGLLPD
jgi:hypothetical protein